MKEKIVGTLSAGMSSMKKGIQSGMDSCKLERMYLLIQLM